MGYTKEDDLQSLFVHWLVILVFIFIGTKSVNAQDVYRDRELHWHFTPRPGWVRESVEDTNRLLRERMPDANWTYIARFTKGTRPYILVQFTRANLTGVSYEQLETTMGALPFSQVRHKVLASISDLLSGLELGRPVLDREHNRLITYLEAADASGIKIYGVSVGLLGKHGLVQMNCYAPAEDFDTAIADFDAMFDTFKLDPDFAFVPAPAIGLKTEAMGKKTGGITLGQQIHLPAWLTSSPVGKTPDGSDRRPTATPPDNVPSVVTVVSILLGVLVLPVVILVLLKTGSIDVAPKVAHAVVERDVSATLSTAMQGVSAGTSTEVKLTNGLVTRRIFCVHCGAPVQAEDVGTVLTIRCGRCDKEFAVPASVEKVHAAPGTPEPKEEPAKSASQTPAIQSAPQTSEPKARSALKAEEKPYRGRGIVFYGMCAISLVVPVVGLIAGCWFLARPDRDRSGLPMICTSVVGSILNWMVRR